MAPDRHPSLADPGALLASTHPIAGGERVRLRLARPSDALRVRTFLEGLSEDTRRRRFLSPMPVVPDAIVRHFTFFDPRTRLVVAAMLPTRGGETLVGLADVALLETGLAELAVVVDDPFQNRGVGSLLAEVSAALALRQGATHLKAELLEENAPMLALLGRLGRTVRTLEAGTWVAYTRLPARRRRAA